MPSSVGDLMAAGGLAYGGAVAWGTTVPSVAPGVYVVSLSPDPSTLADVLPTAPMSRAAVSNLLSVRPELRVDGRRPDVQALARRVGQFWIPDESVLYIGLAGSSLAGRVGAYYSTKLGRRSPHAGGWFIKLIDHLDRLWVHYAASDYPGQSEHRMLEAFVERVSAAPRASLRDPDHPFPFANLEWPPRVRKDHGIEGATGSAVPRDPVPRTLRSESPGRQTRSIRVRLDPTPTSQQSTDSFSPS